MIESTHRRMAKFKQDLANFDQIRTSQGLLPAVVRLARVITQRLFFRLDFFLVARSLLEPTPIVQPINGLFLKQIQISDLDLLATMKKSPDELSYKMLLERGRSCVVVLKGDRAVAHGWFTPKVEPHVERTYVPLSQDEMFIFDLFTRPSFRRQGIQSALIQHMLELGKEKGFKRVLSQITVDNMPSLNLHEKLGFQTVCRFTKIRFLGWVRFYFHPNPYGKTGDVIRWL